MRASTPSASSCRDSAACRPTRWPAHPVSACSRPASADSASPPRWWSAASTCGCRGRGVSIDVSTLPLHGAGGRARPPAEATGPVGAAVGAGRTLTVGDGQRARAEVVERVDVGDDPGARGRLRDVSGVAFDRPAQWETAASVAASACAWLTGAPPCTVLNLNVPNVPFAGLAGARSATLAPFGTVRSAVVEAAPDGGRLQVEFRPTDAEPPPESDTAVVAEGFVAVTALAGIGVDEKGDVSPVLDAVATEGWRTA